MKKILGLITISLLTSLTYSSAALAANWQQIAELENGERFSVDVSSIQGQGPFVRYWVLMEHAPDQYAITSKEAYKITDCRNGNSKLTRIVAYRGSHMAVSYTYGEKGLIEPLTPGTVGEAIVKTVCSY